MIRRAYLVLLAITFSLIFGAAVLQAGEKVKDNNAEKVRSKIESYVKQDVDLKDGFLIYDEKEKKVLNLKYDHVHQGVKRVEDERYFACVDFVDENENVYDLDFYLDKDGDNLEVTDIVIHKINGKSRK